MISDRVGLYALAGHLLKIRLVDFQQADGMPPSDETSIQLVKMCGKYTGSDEGG